MILPHGPFIATPDEPDAGASVAKGVIKPRIELWSIHGVIPYDLNVKQHDASQVAKIAKSIQEFGWDQPIVVDQNGVIIKGHGRRLAALQLGMAQVPVWVRDDLSPEQVRAARLADNRVAISNIDTDLLQQELASLDFDLSHFFDKKELDFMEADLGTLNVDAFVTDLDSAMDHQAQDTADVVAAAANKEVPIAKALGFKTIQGKDERLVVRFMAQLEAELGVSGAGAFLTFVRAVLAQKSAL